jgi:hypothetical protein
MLPENDFDLEKLFLPAWAQEEPSSAKYAKYELEPERPDRREGRRGPRPPRPEGQGFGRREGPRREGRNRPERRGPGGREDTERGERTGRPGARRGEPERREPPAPLPEVNVSLIPEEKGVESLARQIKMTGRAYPLFDIAQMILQKPERHAVVFSVKKDAEGKPVQPLFVCALDDTLWLAENEAVAHILKRHFGTFYQAEKTATEPPKGKYTFVAQCGMSGVVLGPPNHHDYQNQLRKLHADRFSRMPFEVYKSRVRIVRDEEVVKKWIEDQSFRTEYLCLNMPEQVRLGSMEAVEQHFRESHKENIIKPVESHSLSGAAARNLRCAELARLARVVTEDQRRFPLQIATSLSQQFATHGLQFFKVNKTITHVAIARPHYLDLELTPVSEGVKRIVDFINSHPKCNRRQLVETLVPAPVAPPAPAAPAEAPAAGPPPAQPETSGPTPEQTAVISDLHWLIHQGHVIEFANGTLETAKKPAPKPPRPEPKPKAAEAQPGTGEAPAAVAPVESTVPSPETVIPEAPAPEQAQPSGESPPAEAPIPEAQATSAVPEEITIPAHAGPALEPKAAPDPTPAPASPEPPAS